MSRRLAVHAVVFWLVGFAGGFFAGGLAAGWLGWCP